MNGCQLSQCFQQGFDHPTWQAFVVGAAVLALLFRRRRR